MSTDQQLVRPAPESERRVVWFRGGDRPVGGGGNTVFVRPAHDDPARASGADPRPARSQG
ncbi:hypothetical protein SAMN05443637_110167 [Pseudonocardia thermophila]|uniref:Uncharacterized protein n=1 Tax=Pseudonocardia thermophila TaxID=1848 RepID=A0A1M6ULY3_PSETH|nr:hypothetical protein SAMN05443637_110167 [Pseudonocardia thermophila]